MSADGISIPASYSAFLAPISSSKLYNEARASKDEKGMETPYVVMLQSIKILSGDGGGLSGKCGPQIQECWEFDHPRRDAVLNTQGSPHFFNICFIMVTSCAQAFRIRIAITHGLPSLHFISRMEVRFTDSLGILKRCYTATLD